MQDDVGVFRLNAEAAFELGMYSAAIQWYSDAIARTILPASPTETERMQLAALYIGRGLSRLENQQYSLALEDANSAIQLDREAARAYYLKGKSLERLLDINQASESYRMGLRMERTNQKLIEASQEVERVLAAVEVTNKRIADLVNPDYDRFAKLLKWVAENGGKVSILLSFLTFLFKNCWLVSQIVFGILLSGFPCCPCSFKHR